MPHHPKEWGDLITEIPRKDFPMPLPESPIKALIAAAISANQAGIPCHAPAFFGVETEAGVSAKGSLPAALG